MVETASAVVIVQRHDERLNRDSVAFADPSHVAADVDNLGGELVSQNLRQHRAGEFVWRGRRHDRTASEFVQVGAADAACQRLDEHLGVAEQIWRWNVFDANILLGIKPDCFHVSFPPPVACASGLMRQRAALTASFPLAAVTTLEGRAGLASRETNAACDPM